MKLKLTLQKTKGHLIKNYIIGLGFALMGILLFNYKSITIINVVSCVVMFIGGVLGFILSLKNRKKKYEQTINNVEAYEEIK